MQVWSVHKILVMLVSGALMLGSCSKKDKAKIEEKEGVFFCDAEEIEDDFFVGEGTHFKNANTQSDEFAYSGKYSCKLDPDHLYGMTAEFEDLKKGTHIYAECYRLSKYGDGQIVLQSPDGSMFEASSYVESTDGPWDKIVIDHVLTHDQKGLKIFLVNGTETPVYFDDLKITMSTKKRLKKQENSLSIQIDDESFAKLKKFRDKAIEKGQIGKKQKKYVPATISWEGKTYEVELRLKGDWPDHLEGDKWSFRIKIQNDQSLFGMKVFSIQSPHTRYFMDEWFIHKLMQREGVLATRYQFIPVEVNGKTLGIYALEEHFRKELLESQHRREGPIVKINEEALWQARLEDVDYRVPYYESAEILPFDDKNLDEDEQKYNLVVSAQNAMAQVKNFESDLGRVVDLKQMAAYMALTDLGGSYHGMVWHNIRFYFNPITYKLEPIAFDCFAERRDNTHPRAIYGIKPRPGAYPRDTYFNKQFLNDPAYQQFYIEYLKTITPEFVETVMAEIKDEIEENQKLLQTEYPWYNFDVNRLIRRSQTIQKELPELEAASFDTDPYTYDKVVYEGTKGSKRFVKVAALKAYTSSRNDKEQTIRCYNYHVDEIEIIGYSFKKKKKDIVPIKAHTMSAFREMADEFELTVPLEVNRIHYIHNGDTSRFKIVKWEKDEAYRASFGLDLSKETLKGVSVIDKEVVLEGTVDLDKIYIIPEDYKLVVKPGTMINLMAGSSLVCYGDVLIGSLENTHDVVVSSADEENAIGGGLSVLGNENKVEIYNAIFAQMSAFDTQNRPRTGMVSIYECDATIKNCKFLDNQTEDALNLVRCKVSISNCEFENIYSDALDLDFCTGRVDDCQFTQVNNDALDISGSTIHFENITADQIGDKGISVGERSSATAKIVTISNANIALVAKDDSKFTVESAKLSNNSMNGAVFMKKTEYGAAEMTLKISGIDRKSLLIDKGSKINWNNKWLEGKQRVNVDSLYAPFKSKAL